MPRIFRTDSLAEFPSATKSNIHVAWLLACELNRTKPRRWAFWLIGGYWFLDSLMLIAKPVAIVWVLWEAAKLGLL